MALKEYWLDPTYLDLQSRAISGIASPDELKRLKAIIDDWFEKEIKRLREIGYDAQADNIRRYRDNS